ncbi:MAG: Methionyl-tRNA formyltransferase (EC [uncultured Sulfurovum sp.]|uniref:Methionyl-tRNA formyltransferase (EC) n=1 Tax=uncultured Sulfurovum sp. TaxID=269237 RepID=A0A6S6THS8_9BACT|nr:MAG: Methionyl-tRNA formyltransferase (EC [uncultured Sulfurovum sp.]
MTAMLMEEGLDSGPILGYRYFKIPETMLLPELMNKLSDDACTLTTDIIHRFETIEPMEQNRAMASHCKKIKKADGLVDFRLATDFYDKYRAFEGWPGIFLEGGMKVKEVILVDRETDHNMGEILEIKEGSIIVGCNQGSLEIGTLQPASKKAVNAKAYCVGRGLKVGSSLL